jgi:UDP-N-acetyl-D-glucosamine dehydrogenase
MKRELISKFKNRDAKVAVIGLGYVGLPLSVVLAEAGFDVTGIDVDEGKIQTLNQGVSYIQDIPTDRLKSLVDSGKIQGTTDYSILADIDAVSICVPTPLRKTGDPDLSFIISSVEKMAPHVHPGMVVILESTTYPGSTRELLLPKLVQDNGLKIGENFFLAFSPERLDPGREDWTTENTPKVVGGITEDCTKVAAAWYSEALETVVPVSSTEIAEMSKLLENTFRMINIGLVNEMALMCDRLNINVWKVIDAAATKPFGFMKFTPGPGLGGHCIPVDPLYLSWKLRGLQYDTRFINLASEINANMPRYVVDKVQDALNQHEKSIKGSKILVLGAAYKPDVDDLRESPALDIIGLLIEKEAHVQYHDPYISEIKHNDCCLERVSQLMDAVSKADCVVLVTDHSEYAYQKILNAATLIVDTRNAFDGLDGDLSKIFRL